MNHSKQIRIKYQGKFNVPLTDGRVKLSAINTSIDSEQLQVESFGKMIEIVKRRSQSTDNVLVTAVVGQEDFVSTSFLETGLKKSTPVCRISRYFDLETFKAFVELLAADIKKQGSTSHNFDSVEKITEVFSMPLQVAETLFTKSIKQEIEEEQITPLEVLQSISETQLSKILPIPVGTGFLVGGSYMLTNQHVLPDIETAEQCVAQFSFVDSANSETAQTTDYELDSSFFISEPALDYTLIQLRSSMITRQAGFEFGWIQMVEDRENVVPRLKWIELEAKPDDISGLMEKFKDHIDILIEKGYVVLQDDTLMIWHPDSSFKDNYYKDPISVINWLMEQKFKEKIEFGDAAIIVQHPKGRRKQIVLNNNEIIGLYKNYLRYEADTDYGSSGSPVFNDRWELVGLHHAAVTISSDESNQNETGSQSTSSPKMLCHQAVRICSIIEDLKRKSVENHRLRGFIDDFVMTKEHAQFPPLPCALTFDGTNDYIELTKPTPLLSQQPSQLHKASASHGEDFPEFTIEAWVNPYQSDATTTIFSQACTEPWYEKFGDDSIFGEYLLSLQVTPEGTVLFSRDPLWKVSSANFPSHGLLYPLLPPTEAAKNYLPGRRIHPLDLLTLKTGDRLELKREEPIPEQDSPEVKQRKKEKQLILYTEKIKALQLVLYCLGFFPEAHYKESEHNSSMYTYYLNVLTGGLDDDTKQAIASFNAWVLPTIKLDEATGTVTIPAEAIDLFNRRGIILGLGTKQRNIEQQNIEQTSDDIPFEEVPASQQRKGHYGPRVCELQHCLKSLDWEHNPLFGENSPSAEARPKCLENQNLCFEHRSFDAPPAVSITGHYNQREKRSNTANTTAYAMKKLQRAFYQHSDGILSSLSLAALEKAKSYHVSTRESLPLGRFSHIAITFDGQEVKIYINGQLSNRRYTGKHSSGGYISQALLGTRPNRSANNASQVTHRSYFEEAISELRIWKKSLPQNEIVDRLHRRLNNEELENTDLMGYWRLEEGQVENEIEKYTLCIQTDFTKNAENNLDNKEHKEGPDHEKAKKYLVEVNWEEKQKGDKVNTPSGEQRCSIRVFDGSGILIANATEGEAWFDKHLQQQLMLTKEALKKDIQNTDSHPNNRDLIQIILSKLGYCTNAYYVHNAAVSGRTSHTYAAKSKFRSQDARVPARLQSARSFPVVPLPFGLTVDSEIILTPHNKTIETAAFDSDKTYSSRTISADAGITVELWMKHEYGDGKILSGGDESSGTYTLSRSGGRIQLMMHKAGSLPVQIETKEPVVNQQIWHHIAFSWGADSKEVTLYVDSKRQQVIALQAQEIQTLSYKDTYQSIIKFPVDTFAINPHTIKILPGIKSEADFFCCSVTELRLWEVARPQSAIKAYLSQRLNTSWEAKNLVAYWRLDNPANLRVQTTTKNTQPTIVRSLSAPVTSAKTVVFEKQDRMFADISPKHWAFEFIEGLQKVGLSGLFADVDTGKFKPDDPINRQELAILLLNIFGGKPRADRANTLLRFKDEDKIDSRYLEDIEYVWRLGLMSGDVIAENAADASRRILEITFNPTDEVSRGVAVSSIFDSLRDYWHDYYSEVMTDARNEDLERVLESYEDAPRWPAPFEAWIPRKRIALAIQKKLIVHQKKNSLTLDLHISATKAEVAAMLYQAIRLQPDTVSTKLKIDPIGSPHILSTF